MDVKDELKKNIDNFLNSAKLVFDNKDYTSACILYFKALFVVADYIVLISGREKPKDHTDRFRILERYFRGIYLEIDRIFYIYRNTYTTSISKEKCEKVRNVVKKIMEKYKIE
jgi:uncharacterized protein (UPF0332 family)